MELENVRREIRKRYYERAYGGVSKDAFEGATVEEYLALAKIEMPLFSERNLLSRAPLESWRKLASAASDAKVAAEKPQPLWFVRARLDRYNVDDAVSKGQDRISLDLVKSVTGIVPSKGVLAALSLQRCGGEPPSATEPLPIEVLAVKDCSPSLSSAALSSFSAVSLEVVAEQTSPWDAKQITHHPATKLTIRVPRLENAAHLARLPVRVGYLTRLQAGYDFDEIVRGWAESLERLTIGTAVPLAPDVLAACKRLRHVRIEARQEQRGEWIDWAVDHPQTGFVFENGETISLLPIEVQEVYRKIPIAREGTRTRKRFLIEDDLVDCFDLPFAHNGALEEELRAAAKQAKRKVTWGSEMSTFVARATDLETARWVIDQALATKETTNLREPRRPPRRSTKRGK